MIIEIFCIIVRKHIYCCTTTNTLHKKTASEGYKQLSALQNPPFCMAKQALSRADNAYFGRQECRLGTERKKEVNEGVGKQLVCGAEKGKAGAHCQRAERGWGSGASHPNRLTVSVKTESD